MANMASAPRQRRAFLADVVDEQLSQRAVLIVGPKLFIEPGTKAIIRLSSVSDPGL